MHRHFSSLTGFMARAATEVIAKRLSDRGPVMAVDMRNHGTSPWFSTHSYEDMAADLAEVIEAETGGAIDVLGHSMGARRRWCWR